MFEGIDGMVVLLVFYLYLLVRWQYVKRPWIFLLGAAGLAFAMVGLFFSFGAAVVVTKIFTIIGMLAAFAGAVGACFGAKLPGGLEALGSKDQQA